MLILKKKLFDKTPSDTGSSDDSSEKFVEFDQSPTDDSSDDEEEKHINIAKSHLSPESFDFYFADHLEKLKEKRAAKEQQEMKTESVVEEIVESDHVDKEEEKLKLKRL
ncbi:hypothetical protein Hanom_Chr10g00911151 [Helianthus anomalus]